MNTATLHSSLLFQPKTKNVNRTNPYTILKQKGDKNEVMHAAYKLNLKKIKGETLHPRTFSNENLFLSLPSLWLRGFRVSRKLGW